MNIIVKKILKSFLASLLMSSVIVVIALVFPECPEKRMLVLLFGTGLGLCLGMYWSSVWL